MDISFNPYFFIILGAILAFFVFDTIAEWLNLRALKVELPEEFKDTYDEESYRKSQEYARVNTKFGFIEEVFGLIVLLGFWLFGGFDWVDQMARSLGLGVVLTGVIYFGALIVAKSILGLPFELYDTFVIEERFGFNKTDAATFWLDRLKGMILGALIGGVVLATIIAFFEHAGSLAWLWGWMTVSGISLALAYLVPTYVMPIFNKFEPLDDGELKTAILDYAKSVNFPVAEISVMDGSKRSTKSNAFFAGFGKNKKIALFDTLIENHSVKELVSVLAHEIGHCKKGHIPQQIAFGILYMGAMFFLASRFLGNRELFDAFGMQEMSVYAGLLFFSLLFSPLDRALSVFSAIWSRKNEYEADRYAAETTGSHAPLANALKKLSKDNLSNLTPHPFYVFFNYSHPPMLERLKALESLSTISEATGRASE